MEKGVFMMSNIGKQAALIAFRVVRFLVINVLRFSWFVITTAFFAWIGRTPNRQSFDQQSAADEIWDGHPKHYYDNDPPKPFS